MKKNNKITTNQLRSKLLLTNLYNIPSIKNARLIINFNKLKSFNDDIVLEGLFLLEFISSLKTNISYYKKMYQEVNLQITSILRNEYFFYFIILLRLFYFPLLVRRSIFLTEAYNKANNYYFTLTNINSFLLLPDIYFKWNTPINCFLDLNTKYKKTSKLLLQYLNFPVFK